MQEIAIATRLAMAETVTTLPPVQYAFRHHIQEAQAFKPLRCDRRDRSGTMSFTDVFAMGTTDSAGGDSVILSRDGIVLHFY